MDVLGRQAGRFLLVGGLNTAVTVVLLALLARIIDAQLAYTIVFAAGLAFTTFATSRFVFSVRSSWRPLLLFVLWYLTVYAIGLTVVGRLDAGDGRSTVTIALVTVLVTAPLSFLGGRLVFHRTSDPLPPEQGTDL